MAAALAWFSATARAGYAPGCTVALEIPGAVSHEAYAVEIQPDGKIVVAGYADLGLGNGRDFLVARFHPDLSLDTSFNGTGYRVQDLSGRDDEAFAVAVQFDQKIVVGGYVQQNPSKYWFTFARYHRDGSLDTGFGSGGSIALDFSPSANDRLRGLAIQPDGKILGAGFATPSGNQRLVVVRLRKDGNPDPTFDGDGAVLPTIAGSAFSFATDVVVDPDGRIVVSGEARFATSDFLTVRLRTDGSLDPTFNTSGWVATDIGLPVAGTGDSASSLVLQPDGKIVVAGTSNGNAAVVRYSPAGALDGSFGATGRAVHDFGGVDAGNALAMDGAGNLLVAGGNSVPPSRFALARFRPDGTTDLSKTDGISGMEDRGFGVAVLAGGKLLVVGSTQGPSNAKTTLALYNPDGTQDCGSFFLHPTGNGATQFVPDTCPANWDCVNDQAGNAATGPPASHDNFASRVRSASFPARDLYSLDDGLLPTGKFVTEIEIVAQLARGASTAAATLLYQRQGFDVAPVMGSPLTIPNTTFQEFRHRFSALNWPEAELDALEIGIDHTGGGELFMTQIYVKVTLGGSPLHPIDVFTAGTSGDSTSGQVMLNWLNPSYGLYDRTVVRRDDVNCPPTPNDGVPVATFSDGLGQPGSFVDSVPVGPTYFYAAFVMDAEGRPSTGVCRSAKPFNRTAGKVDWIYDTSISALTTPGLRFAGSESVVYTVSNDGLVHAIRGGSAVTGGGSWPPGWKPRPIGASAPARPPVVPLPPSRPAVLLGSQDGHAYAIDAVTGDLIWKSAKLGANVQAALGVALVTYNGGKDLVFVGTRNASQPNRIYALNPVDGAVEWFFDNGGGAASIGMIVSGPTLDYPGRRVYFTSFKGGSGNTLWCLDYMSTPPVKCGTWSGHGVATGGGADVEASPILYQGRVFVPESGAFGDLYAVNPADGLDQPILPLLNGGAKGFVFPQFGTMNLFASTSLETMSVRFDPLPLVNWTSNCVATPSTPTAIPGTDWVFVGSNEGKLFQFSANSGPGCPIPLSTCIGDCSSTIVGAPAFDVRKIMLYAGTDEGKVYAVRAPF